MAMVVNSDKMADITVDYDNDSVILKIVLINGSRGQLI